MFYATPSVIDSNLKSQFIFSKNIELSADNENVKILISPDIKKRDIKNVVDEYSTNKGFIFEPIIENLRKQFEQQISFAVNDSLLSIRDDFLKEHSHELLDNGKHRFVSYGKTPRKISYVFGKIDFFKPRIRDRALNVEVPFCDDYIPRYSRSTTHHQDFLTYLNLNGCNLENISFMTKTLSGPDSDGLSKSTVGKISKKYLELCEQFHEKQFTEKYEAIFADASYVSIKNVKSKICIMTFLGRTEDGKVEVIDFFFVRSESVSEWDRCFDSMIQRGLQAPDIIIGDGNTALWKSVENKFPTTFQQECWVHLSRNVLAPFHNSSVDSLEVAEDLRAIYKAENLENALEKLADFKAKYKKFEKSLKSIDIAENRLFSYFNFIPEKRIHFYTSNVIESFFSTVKNRTKKSKGCLNLQSLSCIMTFYALKFNKLYDKIIPYPIDTKTISIFSH